MQAKEIMTPDVITISSTASVRELATLLTKNNISGIPVTNSKGKIVGIATQADVVGKKGKQVKSIMSKEIISVTEQTPVAEIARILTAHRIKRVPVMRDGELVGIVSQADIVGAIASGKHIAL
ncbi:MAG: CBS domain-containing protein [Candidatus Binatia bacterium]